MKKEFSNIVYFTTDKALAQAAQFPFSGFDFLHADNNVDPRITSSDSDAGTSYKFDLSLISDSIDSELYQKFKNGASGYIIVKDADENTFISIPGDDDDGIALSILISFDSGLYRVSIAGTLTSNPLL